MDTKNINLLLCKKLPKMKKWSGGVMITALALILILSYTFLVRTKPEKDLTYAFFHTHPSTESPNERPEFTMPSKTEINKALKPATKPRLVHVEGLDELFSNTSSRDSIPMLVWGHMRELLSRSDALPETAQGVKEASVAWRELVLTIEEKDSIFGGSDRAETEYENCPFSVDAIRRTESVDETVLELPCGLVEGSSISLVGVPGEPHKSFRIQLLGSQLSGESEAPIALHYNVSLPGDDMTKEPFIVQNTWTEDLGWGQEERCPSHRSSNTVKVDGLVLCNKQIFRSSSEENKNTSQPSQTASFPFGKGIPFTATLWAGFEGFHMTVNGRHETSFPYKEKLEPWLVSKVKVSGGLTLRSVLAKDLPVSEDHDIVIDAKSLKAPLLRKKRLVMLVGVFSTGNNFERRMALRRTWMQYEAVRSGDVAVRFFIGLHKNKQVNYELWREAQAYGDIQLMPFVDYYTLISYKTIAICVMGTKIMPAKYIMKTDDDAFVRIDEVLSSLKKKAPTGLLYGLISYDSSPQRDTESKWYISQEEWPHNSYPPWAHGPGYIISRDIAKFIVRGHNERDLRLFKLEDVAMGIWIEQFKNNEQEVQYSSDERFYNAGCESNYTLAHYQNPRLVLCLWEKLQKEQNPICCE